MEPYSRRSFLAAGSVAVISGVAIGKPGYHGESLREAVADGITSQDGDGFDGHDDPDRVREFVGACHVQIDKVRAMLEIDPDLAKASWDWGFGDYETAVGACSHTGRKDIIELLMAHGARPTIFTLATLDKIAAVRGFIESMPGATEIEGPHSISLYRHAQAGKATRVMEYLEGVGLGDGPNLFETDRDAVEPYIGVYETAPDSRQRFEIKWSERWVCLSIETPEMTSRNLMPLKEERDAGAGEVFRPAGSLGARISFQSGQQLVINHGGRTWKARRVEG